jgi:hypothetical protein
MEIKAINSCNPGTFEDLLFSRNTLGDINVVANEESRHARPKDRKTARKSRRIKTDPGKLFFQALLHVFIPNVSNQRPTTWNDSYTMHFEGKKTPYCLYSRQ